MRVWICMMALATWMLQADGRMSGKSVPLHTPVEIELLEGLSSETLHAGQEIAFKVSSPVIVEDETVIGVGTPVQGEVRAVGKAGAFRKAGMLQLAFKPIRLDDGTVVQLDFPHPRMKGTAKEKTATGIAGVAASPFLLYYFPLIPFAVAESVKKGAPFTIRAGERYRVYVVGSRDEAEMQEPPTAAQTPKP